MPEKSTLCRIHDAAMAEFSEKGFRSASLRNIVKKAGVTTGALYGYFDSKEALFDSLVAPQYTYFMHEFSVQIGNFAKLPAQRMQYAENACMSWITNFVYDHQDIFHLLLTGAEGTKYEHMVRDLVELETQTAHEFAENLRKSGIPVQPVDPILENMLISGLISSFFTLLLREIPKEQSLQYAKQLEAFYAAGWQKLLGY